MALDGSPLAEQALVPATELVTAVSSAGSATLNLLRVVELAPMLGASPTAFGAPGGFGLTDDLYIAAMEEAQTYLSRVADRLRERLAAEHPTVDARITTTAVLSADVAGTLAAVAEGRKATVDTPALAPSDLIAVATHGRGGLKRLILGSVTERLSTRPRCPCSSRRRKRRRRMGNRRARGRTRLIETPEALAALRAGGSCDLGVRYSYVRLS